MQKSDVKEEIVMFGTGVLAEMNHFYLTHDSPYEVVAFTVDRQYRGAPEFRGLPVVAFEDVVHIYPPHRYGMCVSMAFGRVNKSRAEKYAEAKAKGYRLISYVSSKATTWPGMRIGDNCFIYENCIIQPFAEIGNDVLIGSGSNVGHHAAIKDHCFLAMNTVLAGCVTLEPYCFIGANSTIRDDVTVARECIIGIGVTLSRNTRERGVYVARPPELLAKPSDELSAWLTWPIR